MQSNTFCILTWGDMREKIYSLNPELCNEIDNIKGSQSFKVLLMKYSFGSSVLDKGKWNINFNGKLQAFNDPSTPKEIKQLLDYEWKGLPPGIVIENSIESHIDHHSHIIPFVLHYPGKVFSAITLFEDDNQSNFIAGLRSLKAGCRSLLMLSKITCSRGNHNLSSRFNVTKNLYPESYSKHWALFKEIADSPKFNTMWHSELMFFSKNFFSSNASTLKFRHKLLCDIWNQTSFRREEVTFEFIWSCFIKSLPLSLRHDLFIIETVKHLIKIVMRQVPGYVPAYSDIPAPISDFKEAFLEYYKPRYYWPTFMQLAYYDGTQSIYYSLQKHTFFRDIPKERAIKETIIELKYIRNILQEFLEYISMDKLQIKLRETSLFRALERIKFDFFHPHGCENILSDITELTQKDFRFTATHDERYFKKKLTFPKHALFFHGCIRITPLAP